MKHRLAAADRQQAYESMLADLQSGECVVFDDSRSGPTVVRFCGKQLGIINEEEYQRKAKPFQAALTQRQFTKDLGFRGIGQADALPRLHLGSSLVGSRGGDAERLVQRG